MSVLVWIVASSILMSLIAWIGLLLLAFRQTLLRKIQLPLVAFSAGALLGGAFLHLLPESLAQAEGTVEVFLLTLLGFALFFLMEEFISWHQHGEAVSQSKRPFTYLILLADGVHNFLGGVAIGSSFLVGVNVGVITWISAAAHEIPQELGDFAILIHGGWHWRRALAFNFLSAAAVLPGGLIAYFLSGAIDTNLLLPFAAGNFLYVSASDLIPEVKHGPAAAMGRRITHFVSFVLGILLIWTTRALFL